MNPENPQKFIFLKGYSALIILFSTIFLLSLSQGAFADLKKPPMSRPDLGYPAVCGNGIWEREKGEVCEAETGEGCLYWQTCSSACDYCGLRSDGYREFAEDTQTQYTGSQTCLTQKYCVVGEYCIEDNGGYGSSIRCNRSADGLNILRICERLNKDECVSKRGGFHPLRVVIDGEVVEYVCNAEDYDGDGTPDGVTWMELKDEGSSGHGCGDSGSGNGIDEDCDGDTDEGCDERGGEDFTVVRMSHQEGDTDVDTRKPVNIVFSAHIAPDTIADGVRLENLNKGKDIQYDYAVVNGTIGSVVKLTPKFEAFDIKNHDMSADRRTRLFNSSAYRITVTTDVTDTAGVPLLEDTVVNFTTEPPVYIGADNAAGMERLYYLEANKGTINSTNAEAFAEIRAKAKDFLDDSNSKYGWDGPLKTDETSRRAFYDAHRLRMEGVYNAAVYAGYLRYKGDNTGADRYSDKVISNLDYWITHFEPRIDGSIGRDYYVHLLHLGGLSLSANSLAHLKMMGAAIDPDFEQRFLNHTKKHVRDVIAKYFEKYWGNTDWKDYEYGFLKDMDWVANDRIMTSCKQSDCFEQPNNNIPEHITPSLIAAASIMGDEGLLAAVTEPHTLWRTGGKDYLIWNPMTSTYGRDWCAPFVEIEDGKEPMPGLISELTRAAKNGNYAEGAGYATFYARAKSWSSERANLQGLDDNFMYLTNVNGDPYEACFDFLVGAALDAIPMPDRFTWDMFYGSKPAFLADTTYQYYGCHGNFDYTGNDKALYEDLIERNFDGRKRPFRTGYLGGYIPTAVHAVSFNCSSERPLPVANLHVVSTGETFIELGWDINYDPAIDPLSKDQVPVKTLVEIKKGSNFVKADFTNDNRYTVKGLNPKEAHTLRLTQWNAFDEAGPSVEITVSTNDIDIF